MAVSPGAFHHQRAVRAALVAQFIVLIPYTGLTDTTVIIPLTRFSLCVCCPRWWTVSGRCRAGPAGRGSDGFGTTRRLVQVELPLAVPIVIAGRRVAVVSRISLASVGQLIGVAASATSSSTATSVTSRKRSTWAGGSSSRSR